MLRNDSFIEVNNIHIFFSVHIIQNLQKIKTFCTQISCNDVGLNSWEIVTEWAQKYSKI